MRKVYISFLVIVAVLFVIASCKKYADPPPYFEKDSIASIIGKRKVLMIGIDGLPGKEFKALNIPNMKAMLSKSKFSLNSIVDDVVTTDAASWKTLLSGNNFVKHEVRDSTFESLFKPAEGQIGKNYPSLFYFVIRSAKPDLQSRFVSCWPDMLKLLTPEVTVGVPTTNDAATKDSVVAALKSKNDDLIVVHFNSSSIAGKAGAFSATNSGYAAAVTKIDSYVNDIMTALKARPGYNKEEDWLVIITGTHGGINNTYGGNTDEEIMVPAIYYNEKFKPIEMVMADYSSILISGRDANAVKAQALNDGGLYSVGTGQQTVQMKIKGASAFGNYPHWISTMSSWPSTSGWSIFSGGGNWAISVRSTTSGEQRIQGAASGNYSDGKWHTLTVVFFDSAASRWVKRFTDDMRISGTANLGAGFGDIQNSGPLTFGWGADPGYNPVSYEMADVRIFNTALTDQEITSNLCLTDISKHPKYSNLIGFWPCNDGFGTRFKNQAPGKSAFPLNLSGPFVWNTDPVIPCSITPTVLGSDKVQTMLSSAGIPSTIFYWLKISVNNSWGIEPSNWLSLYESEFIGIK